MITIKSKTGCFDASLLSSCILSESNAKLVVGMVTEADLDSWKPSDFKAHIDHVIKNFGIDRVMFGSDWPVCKLANANLPDVYNLLNGLLKDLSKEDKRKIFVANGQKFYNLSL